MKFFASLLYFYPIAFIVLILVAAVAIAVFVRRIMKWSVFASAALAACIAIAIAGSSYWALVSNLATAKDHAEAAAVAKVLRAAYPFRTKEAAGPSFYTRPHPKRSEFIVYGVVDPAEQDKILAILKQARSVAPNKPLVVTFKPAEKFRSDSSGFSSRVDQSPLRVERVDGQ